MEKVGYQAHPLRQAPPQFVFNRRVALKDPRNRGFFDMVPVRCGPFFILSRSSARDRGAVSGCGIAVQFAPNREFSRYLVR